MLHNKAQELLVRGYEAIHDTEEIAKAYSVSKWTVYRLVGQKRKTGILSQAASTVQTIHGTIKTGKATYRCRKGCGGRWPCGAAAGAAIYAAHHSKKLLAAAAILLMLPVLFVFTLPSLIFGGLTRISAGTCCDSTDSGDFFSSGVLYYIFMVALLWFMQVSFFRSLYLKPSGA